LKISISNIFAAIVILITLFACEKEQSIEEPLFNHAETDFMQQDPILIKGGMYFETDSKSMQKNSGIVVQSGKIMIVDGDVSKWEDIVSEVLTLEEHHYILPGIIDMHAHYNMDLIGGGRVEDYQYNPVVYLANGVTSTWPGGSYNPEGEFKLRNRIISGEQIGPRIFNSGPYFGRARRGWNPDYTAQDIHNQVDYWAKRGVHSFKAKSIAEKHLKPLIERAHFHGLTVSGHVGSGGENSVNAKDAIYMGIDRVEHVKGGDVLEPGESTYGQYRFVDVESPEFADIAETFIKYNVFHSPTMSITARWTEEQPGWEHWVEEDEYFTSHVQEYVDENPPFQFREVMNDLYWKKYETNPAFHEMGGKLVLSTDNPSQGTHLSGFNAHRELHTFVMAGIPEEDALIIASLNGAKALNVSDRLGSIETGKFADLFIVKGNPLEDITNTRNVKHVIKAGNLYDPDQLLDSIKGKIGPDGPEEEHNWIVN